jgi:uncharacterized protein YjiS (DUF1127 family)
MLIMSANTANDTSSFYFKSDVPYMPQPEATGFLGGVRGLFRSIAEMSRRSRMMRELRTLTDHDLADAGISRAELRLAFDKEFAAKWNAERHAARQTNHVV